MCGGVPFLLVMCPSIRVVELSKATKSSVRLGSRLRNVLLLFPDLNIELLNIFYKIVCMMHVGEYGQMDFVKWLVDFILFLEL
jgi:hypothetical protein